MRRGRGFAESLLARFERHLRERALIPQGCRVLVGYSGGADSTCLLHMLHALGWQMVAAHLHHGQRPEADEEAERCRGFAEGLEIGFAMGRADVPRMARELRLGIEEAGRRARYEFFSRAAKEFGCERIATGHTRSDLVETVVFNLIRGSGLRGLAGIPERQGVVVRPLLPFSREETREYCHTLGLWTHEDPANKNLNLSRARIRHRILPEMRAINPAVEDAVTRLAETASEEDLFLWAAAHEALSRCHVPFEGALAFLSQGVEARYDLDLLKHLPPVLFRRALRLAAESLGANLDFQETRALEDGLRSSQKGSVTAEGGRVALEWRGRELAVRQLEVVAPYRHPLTLPGDTLSDEFGWMFRASYVQKEFLRPDRKALEVDLEPASIKGSLYFRCAAPGDSMRPIGFQGTRKLADLLSEAKLSRAARKRLPIVCDMIGPVWAPGVCLDERARIRDGATRAIRVRFGPIEPETETCRNA